MNSIQSAWTSERKADIFVSFYASAEIDGLMFGKWFTILLYDLNYLVTHMILQMSLIGIYLSYKYFLITLN